MDLNLFLTTESSLFAVLCNYINTLEKINFIYAVSLIH